MRDYFTLVMTFGGKLVTRTYLFTICKSFFFFFFFALFIYCLFGVRVCTHRH